MSAMKRIAVIALATALLGTYAGAGGSGWQTDFTKAAKKAKKADRPILAEFTKGDASKRINKQVFYKGKFKTWAKKNVVLFSVDLGKKVSKKLTAQYAGLQKKYKLETFPTILLLDHEGKVLGTPKFERDTNVAAWIKDAGEIVEAASGAGEWITDWEKAKKISKRTRKPMLVDFNGSDW